MIETYNLDEIEAKILSQLSTNARINIVQISNLIRCSVDKVHYRLKNLISKNIISGSRIMINRNLLGYQYHKIFLKLNFQKNNDEKSIRQYLRLQKNVVDVSVNMGNWDMEIDVDVKNNLEFHSFITNLKSQFPKLINDYESVLVIKEYKYDFFPMKENYEN